MRFERFPSGRQEKTAERFDSVTTFSKVFLLHWERWRPYTPEERNMSAIITMVSLCAEREPSTMEHPRSVIICLSQFRLGTLVNFVRWGSIKLRCHCGTSPPFIDALTNEGRTGGLHCMCFCVCTVGFSLNESITPSDGPGTGIFPSMLPQAIL